MSNNKRRPSAKKPRTCDLCGGPNAKRKDIPTGWFRGDDVVLNVCKEHSKPIHEADLLKTPEAIRQMEQA
jgi:hypothetical protein